jgi:hypothetical protein
VDLHLATITEEGFAKLDRHKLALMSTKTYSADSFERERQVKDDLTDANITKEKASFGGDIVARFD